MNEFIPNEVDRLFLDTTFCAPLWVFPTKVFILILFLFFLPHYFNYVGRIYPTNYKPHQ